MSYTEFGVNDANAVHLWAKVLARAERDSLEIAPLMGTDDNAIIHVKEETEKGAGDKVMFNLRGRPKQDGFTESMTAEGNGESLTILQDSIYINELGGVMSSKSENTIDAQRVPFKLRQECKNALVDWWSDRKSESFLNQVCGYLPANGTGAGQYLRTGNNAVTDSSGSTDKVRQIWPGAVTNDEGLGSSDTFTVGLIDNAVAAARTGDVMVRQVKVAGQPKYVCYLHEQQVVQLRTSTSQGSWQDITKFTYSGVDPSKNPLYSGALGEYNGCILRRSQDITKGVHHTTGAAVANTRRAVLLGAQAAATAYGMKNAGQVSGSATSYRWNEELLDHKRKLEVSAWAIWGLKKTVYDSVDYGTVVISTYSAS